jgi:hypothetical protein
MDKVKHIRLEIGGDGWCRLGTGRKSLKNVRAIFNEKNELKSVEVLNESNNSKESYARTAY